MKQKTCAVQDSYDVVKFLDTIKKSSDYKNAESVLVNVFTERIQKDYITYISELIKDRLKKAKVSGLTCLLGFAQGENLNAKTILTVLLFEKSEIEVFEYDFDKTPVNEAKESFIRKVENTPDIKGVQIFTTSLKNSISNEFLSTLDSDKADFPIFGAGAGFEAGVISQKLLVFGCGTYKNGIVITLFKGPNLMIYAESTLGWTPVGKEFEVTEVQNNHILKSLDNTLAADIYKNYLGVTSSKYFNENTCEFPFMLKRNGKWLARIPVEKDEKGFIHFIADIHEGEKLFFSYGSKKKIIQQSFNLAEYMSRKNLDGLILHICRNRYTYLKDDEMLELQAFSNFYRETAGCFTFSELLYKNKSGGLHNSALLAIGFRESEDTEAAIYSEDCYVEDFFYGQNRFNDFDSPHIEVSVDGKKHELLPFEDRIVNFLNATSRDLHRANLRLEEIATTDGLTKIFNRKMISERINYELSRRDDNRKICLIMFDIDNFKRINDTYGHDAGDAVLVRLSQTARNCIRNHDSIGRWGGEEFMILLPDTDKKAAAAIAERIRVEINSLKWEKMNPVSVSLGLAQVRSDDSSQSLYKRVDNCLYHSKTSGKNQLTTDDDF